jgi:MFS transporter, NNP family, nitrate/nitrite transporter
VTAEPISPSHTGRHKALALATLGFAANFWAWGLIAPLAPDYRDLLALPSLQISVLVATPVLLGSLLRIPIGALTDRYGGRLMFTVCSLAMIIPLAILSVAESYPLLLLGALLLGIGGASFAVGVPFVNAWFPPHQRGFALGIYGLGNIGTGLAGFSAPGVSALIGRQGLFLMAAAILVLVAVAILLAARDAPGRQPPTEPFLRRLAVTARLRTAQDLAGLYAITFGGFVAFGVYLPTYLQEVYGLATIDAAARTGGFITLATAARPVGGWLADRRGGAPVVRAALGVVGIGAIVAAFEANIAVATVAFLSIAAALGVGNGAVFGLVSMHIPVDRVGSVTGLVGAAGGLGGFLPPIVMGLVREATGSFAIGLMLLSTVAFAGMVHTWWRFIILERLDLARDPRAEPPPHASP